MDLLNTNDSYLLAGALPQTIGTISLRQAVGHVHQQLNANVCGGDGHGLGATALMVPAGGQAAYRLKVATTAAWSVAGSAPRSPGSSVTEGSPSVASRVRASGLFRGMTRRWLAKM
jgi:hypothetical protein